MREQSAVLEHGTIEEGLEYTPGAPRSTDYIHLCSCSGISRIGIANISENLAVMDVHDDCREIIDAVLGKLPIPSVGQSQHPALQGEVNIRMHYSTLISFAISFEHMGRILRQWQRFIRQSLGAGECKIRPVQLPLLEKPEQQIIALRQ